MIRLFSTSIILTFMLLSILTPVRAEGSFEDKHIKVALRMIGHKLLLSLGDSTSRVLPITASESEYTIAFESEIAFNPDDLVTSANEVLTDAQMSGGYIMEVKECENGDIVHSFEVADLDNIDVIPCAGRDLPKSCYNIIFTLSPDQSQLSPDQLLAEDLQNGHKHVKFYASGLLVMFIVLAFLFVRNKKTKSNGNSKGIRIGKYKFDPRASVLIMQEQRTELTGKEADLLILLNDNLNETVERETILNKVWKDEGDYIGRTLDVFISKLRKKLEADPDVKIVNVRGVGYRLVVG